MLLWNFTWISILKIKSLGSKKKNINLIYSSNHFSSSQTKFDLLIINLKRNQLKAKSCWTRSTQLTLTRLRPLAFTKIAFTIVGPVWNGTGWVGYGRCPVWRRGSGQKCGFGGFCWSFKWVRSLPGPDLVRFDFWENRPFVAFEVSVG